MSMKINQISGASMSKVAPTKPEAVATASTEQVDMQIILHFSANGPGEPVGRYTFHVSSLMLCCCPCSYPCPRLGRPLTNWLKALPFVHIPFTTVILTHYIHIPHCQSLISRDSKGACVNQGLVGIWCLGAIEPQRSGSRQFT